MHFSSHITILRIKVSQLFFPTSRSFWFVGASKFVYLFLTGMSFRASSTHIIIKDVFLGPQKTKIAVFLDKTLSGSRTKSVASGQRNCSIHLLQIFGAKWQSSLA
eukprot:Platyproteum_vivax@DN9865_c0_g1_i1.p1